MNIQQLKTQGIIERIGPDKGGYWNVKHKSGRFPEKD